MPTTPSTTWNLAHNRTLPLNTPQIMAIINITTDSFSDGGLHNTTDSATDFALKCLDQGATLLDLGGESSRPGATPVPPAEQIKRIIPVLEIILKHRSDTIISIDTSSAIVAQTALQSGANIINDISAGRDDPDMFNIVYQYHAGLILMHRLRPPANDQFSHEYNQSQKPDYHDSVTNSVKQFLSQQAQHAQNAGITQSQIVIDPGLGFGKTVEQNLQLIREIKEFKTLNFPILSAASRKSFIGEITNIKNPADRIHGSLAVSAYHYLAGIRLFRVHDIKAHRELFATLQNIAPSNLSS